MWNVPTYRIRAYVRNLRKSRKSTASAKRPPLHLKRSHCELSVQNHSQNVISLTGTQDQKRIVPATILLNDITPRGAFVFSSEALTPGTTISMSIQGPRRFYVKARVMTCQQIGVHGGLIHEGLSYPHRIGMLFEFATVEERLAVRRYFDDLALRYLRSSAC